MLCHVRMYGTLKKLYYYVCQTGVSPVPLAIKFIWQVVPVRCGLDTTVHKVFLCYRTCTCKKCDTKYSESSDRVPKIHALYHVWTYYCVVYMYLRMYKNVIHCIVSVVIEYTYSPPTHIQWLEYTYYTCSIFTVLVYMCYCYAVQNQTTSHFF